MLTNRRSSSLLALTLVAIAGGVAAYAGPLQPAAGPIVSTHKTLTEVEPGIIIETTLIRNCHASYNDLTGIWVTGNGATVQGCTAFQNTTNGIFVAESVGLAPAFVGS